MNTIEDLVNNGIDIKTAGQTEKRGIRCQDIQQTQKKQR